MEIILNPTPPFRLDLTAWALRRRSINAIDRWDGTTYRRTLTLGGRTVEIAVTQIGSPDRPRLRVETSGAALGDRAKAELIQHLERLLGLRVDLSDFYAFARKDAQLAPLANHFRGVKPPRFPSVFEGLVNGIACQQLSLTVGITLLNRLAEHFGAAAGGTRAFPRARDLADQDAGALHALGFSQHKAEALLAVAKAAEDNSLDLEGLAALDDESALQRLQALRGVGRWTAEYVLLRGLGRLHVFPGDDVGARKSLAKWLGLEGALDYAGTQAVVDRWRPYAGLIYFHLLLHGLAEKENFA
ncbi:MAG TPA: AlkA N-terminal domain-containing protein [Gallionella sp.]|nr:AlkA N-terminal domain-containing protein [Gallionella sp.]